MYPKYCLQNIVARYKKFTIPNKLLTKHLKNIHKYNV